LEALLLACERYPESSIAKALKIPSQSEGKLRTDGLDLAFDSDFQARSQRLAMRPLVRLRI
jgi:hypothetical protein